MNNELDLRNKLVTEFGRKYGIKLKIDEPKDSYSTFIEDMMVVQYLNILEEQ